MIHDVDLSLAAWLCDLLPGVAVTFDPPSRAAEPGEGAARRALVLHLADLHEEPGGSTSGWSALRGDDGVVVGRVPGVRRFRLTYLLMGQGEDTLAEHDVLGHALEATSRYDVVPTAHLAGSMKEVGDRAVMVRCAPSTRTADARELWRAWGVAPRTVLELSVLAPLPTATIAEVAAPPSEVSLGVDRGAPRPAASPPAPGRRPTGRITE